MKLVKTYFCRLIIVIALSEFFTAKLEDHHSIIPYVLEALALLVSVFLVRLIILNLIFISIIFDFDLRANVLPFRLAAHRLCAMHF